MYSLKRVSIYVNCISDISFPFGGTSANISVCFGASLHWNKRKNNRQKKILSKLGEEIGLLFQFADDFLDVKGSKRLVGKPVKKDNKKGKSTLINLMGYEKAYNYANNLKKKILLKLKKHGKKAKDLSDTIEFILGRNF